MSKIPNWKYIRLAIINLDDHVCRICFSGATDISFDVHHMDWNRSNNKCSNLVTLCQSCHKQIHLNHYKPENHDDWPTPWKIERPSEEEFDLIVANREPKIITEKRIRVTAAPKKRRPTKYNEDYPWDFVLHKPKQPKTRE